jgi:hypothetical protein
MIEFQKTYFQRKGAKAQKPALYTEEIDVKTQKRQPPKKKKKKKKI